MTGSSLYGYQLLRLLGTGGMADIYYAENSLGKPAAIKVLKLKYSDEQVVHDRFISEAKTTVKLHHPNIREVYDLGEIEGRPAIIMEYLEGHSLLEVLREEGNVDDQKALEWFQQIVSGLQYTHKRGVIHRDIKPSNLFLTNDEKIKILDFGIAKVKENITMTQTGQTLGTLTYMSPEQVMDPKRVDERTDIYSLGVTFYHLLTGKIPYDITTDSGYVIQRKIVEEELDLKNLPGTWKERLDFCLRKKAGERKLEKTQPNQNTLSVAGSAEENKNAEAEMTFVEPSRPVAGIPEKNHGFSSWLPIRSRMWYYVVIVLMFFMGLGIWKTMPTMFGSKELTPYYDPDARLWGIRKGEGTLVQAKYHYIHPFVEGMARIEMSGIFGFIDSRGHEVIPVEYDYAWDFSEGVAMVRLNGRYGFVDQTGNEVIPLKYDYARSFSEGLARVKLNGKQGFVDQTGKEVIPIKFDGTFPNTRGFSGGLAAVKLNGKYGFVDQTGKEVIPLKYDYAWGFSEGLAKVELNGKYGFVDQTGKEVIPLVYDDLRFFSEGLLVAVKLNGKYGFVDQTGKGMSYLKYDDLGDFSEGLVKVELNGKYGFVDQTEKEVIPLEYDAAGDFSEGLAKVGLNRKYGFVDRAGKEVIPIKYNNVLGFSEGLARVELNNKWFFIDRAGKEVFAKKYDDLGDFSEGLAMVKLNGKWGFLDRTGKEVIPMRYDFVFNFSEGLARVLLNGKWGFVDRTGKEVIPILYDRVTNFSEGLVQVELNGKDFYINKKGKTTLNFGPSQEFLQLLFLQILYE